MTEGFAFVLSGVVAISRVWLLSTKSAVPIAEALDFLIFVILVEEFNTFTFNLIIKMIG